MAKAGKVHHWKHGWIPLDAFARSQVKRPPIQRDRVVDELPPKGAPRSTGLPRFKATTIDADTPHKLSPAQSKGTDHSADAAAAAKLINDYKFKVRGGADPKILIGDRAIDGQSFVYDPATGKVSGSLFHKASPGAMTNVVTVNVIPRNGFGRDNQSIDAQNFDRIDAAMQELLRFNAPLLRKGAKVGGRPLGKGQYQLGIVAA